MNYDYTETLAARIRDKSQVAISPVFVSNLCEIADANGITRNAAWTAWKRYANACRPPAVTMMLPDCALYQGKGAE